MSRIIYELDVSNAHGARIGAIPLQRTGAHHFGVNRYAFDRQYASHAILAERMRVMYVISIGLWIALSLAIVRTHRHKCEPLFRIVRYLRTPREIITCIIGKKITRGVHV